MWPRPRLRQRRRLQLTRRCGSSQWRSPSSARRDAGLTIQATLPARRATPRRRRRQPRLTTQTPFLHLPPPLARLKRPHQRSNLHSDTKQQRTDQSRAHPQLHDDGPDIAAAAEMEVAAAATAQPREELQPTVDVQTNRQRKRKRPAKDTPPLPPPGLSRSPPWPVAENPHPDSPGSAPLPPAGDSFTGSPTGPVFCAPGSLARRRLARAIHYHHPAGDSHP